MVAIRTRLMRTAAITTLTLCASAVLAQEERAIDNFAGIGVRSMGMGGAFTGVADDFTAVFWNPAGLAQMQKREVYVALSRNAIENESRLGGVQAAADLSNTRFGSLGFVYPYPVQRGAFVVAAGFNRVKDFDWTLRIVGSTDSLSIDDTFIHEGELTLTTAAVAVDVTPSVSLGLSLSLIQGENERSKEFVSIDTADFFFESRFLDRYNFSDEYEPTWTATLGAMLRVPRREPRLRVGASVTTGPTHSISYVRRAPPDTAFSLIEYDDGRVKSESSVNFKDSYELSLPISFSLGGSYRLAPSLMVAASLYATEWSQTEYFGEDELELRSNTSFEDQYDDVLRYHLGVEWQVPIAAVDLRAGYYTDPLSFVGPRDPSKAPDPQANPMIRSLQERTFLTFGAGAYLEEAVKVDAAFTRGRYEQAEGVDNNELREKVTVNRVFFGVSYRF
ncbi:MAG: outer membrane protein transport protein [Candidatus Latescibacterota bacterium]|nr:outer membrane protein transport protein [Candidatus Latescibacterota bacterium]